MKTTSNAASRLRALVLLGIVTIATLSACSNGDEDQTTRNGVDGDYSGVEVDQAIEVDAEMKAGLERGTKAYLDAYAAALRNPKKAGADPSGVTGPAEEALAGMVAEYAQSGWHVVGTPTFVSSVVVERTEDPETMAVAACLDSTGVRVVDTKGRDVPGSTTPPRTLNVFVLVREDDRWVVARQTLPDDPDC